MKCKFRENLCNEHHALLKNRKGKQPENLHSSYYVDEIRYKRSAIILLTIYVFRENGRQRKPYILCWCKWNYI